MQTYHFETNYEGEGLIKKPGQYKRTKAQEKRRTKRIKAIISILTTLYCVAALLYTYKIDITITLR